MKKSNLLLGFAFVFIFSSMILASAQNVNNTSYAIHTGAGSSLSVVNLKYEPYPVNAGDWFTIWIKVQNTGNVAAKNAAFELVPQYPFSSNDILVSSIGTLSTLTDTNQIVLKYNVKVADDVGPGDYNLQFKTVADQNDPNAANVITSLPITVGNTKTDFDVVAQGSSASGTSFAIANIGSNAATAITVSMLPAPGLIISGPSSSIIGNLAAGDYTTVSFQISRITNSTVANSAQRTRNFNSTAFQNPGNSQGAIMQISYTDSAGVRNTVNETIPFSSFGSSAGFGARTTATTKTSSISYVSLFLGILVGIIAFTVYRKIKKKK